MIFNVLSSESSDAMPPEIAAQSVQAAKRKPGRPRLSEQLPETLETRAQIIRDAKRLFMQRGYSAISISHIVEAVGVTKPTLYYYFPDKEHLYAAVLADMIACGTRHYLPILSGPETAEHRIHQVVHGYLIHCPTSVNLLMRDAVEYLSQETAPTVVSAYREYLFDPFQGLFTEGIQNGEFKANLDAGTVTMMFLSQLDAFHVWEQLQTWYQQNYTVEETQILPLEILAEQFTTIFINGIRV